MRRILGLVVGLVLLPSIAQAELIVNGGFETGSFSSWTQSGNTGFTGVGAGNQNTGTYGAFFGPVGSFGFIEQNIATVAGATYNVSFWLQNLSGGVPNEFRALWDGITYSSLTNASAFGYTQFNFVLTALDASTTVRFGFQHNPSYYLLDDVSVNQIQEVPVPAGVILAGVGMICLGGFSLRRRKQVATA